MAWERDELRAAIEAMLFASDAPVSVAMLCDVLPGADETLVKACIGDLKETYGSAEGGLQIVLVAGGYHIRTRPEVSHWVERLLRKRRKMRLSQAALETLAIVAYKQPVTKMEMESIRGVDVGGVLGTLLERNLITIKGRSKGPGRPLLYRTTAEFLDHFGLNNLEDLPSLEELESLLAKRDEEAAEDVPVGVAPEGDAPEDVPVQEQGEGDAPEDVPVGVAVAGVDEEAGEEADDAAGIREIESAGVDEEGGEEADDAAGMREIESAGVAEVVDEEGGSEEEPETAGEAPGQRVDRQA
jgi:segregation and condensation protein B